MNYNDLYNFLKVPIYFEPGITAIDIMNNIYNEEDWILKEDGWMECRICGTEVRGMIPVIDHWGGCQGKPFYLQMKTIGEMSITDEEKKDLIKKELKNES